MTATFARSQRGTRTLLRAARAACIAILLPLALPSVAQPGNGTGNGAQLRGRTPTVVANALARSGIPESAVGLLVQDLDGGEPVVALNADSVMNPASTMKLLTTFAALELLGPSFTWRTEMVTQAPQRGDRRTRHAVREGLPCKELEPAQGLRKKVEIRARGRRGAEGLFVLSRSFAEVEDLARVRGK